MKLLLNQIGLTYVAEDEYILITAPGKDASPSIPKPSTISAQSGRPSGGEVHAAAPLPTVRVTQPVVCDVCDYEEYGGRVESGGLVPVTSPVRGRVVFKVDSPTVVKTGDLLAIVIPEKEWEERGIQGKLESMRLAYRNGRMANRSSAANGRTEEWKSARAEFDRACENSNPTKVLATFSGQCNLTASPNVATNSGATIAAITVPDSLVVTITFDVPESTVLAHRRLPERKPNWELSLPVVFALSDDKGFPYRGKIVSVAADIDPKTQTQRWQGVVPNKDGLFMPGMSVRVRRDYERAA